MFSCELFPLQHSQASCSLIFKTDARLGSLAVALKWYQPLHPTHSYGIFDWNLHYDVQSWYESVSRLLVFLAPGLPASIMDGSLFLPHNRQPDWLLKIKRKPNAIPKCTQNLIVLITDESVNNRFCMYSVAAHYK